MITITIDPRGGGPDFENDTLFEVRLDGRIAEFYATPAEVAVLVRNAMMATTGHHPLLETPSDVAMNAHFERGSKLVKQTSLDSACGETRGLPSSPS